MLPGGVPSTGPLRAPFFFHYNRARHPAGKSMGWTAPTPCPGEAPSLRGQLLTGRARAVPAPLSASLCQLAPWAPSPTRHPAAPSGTCGGPEGNTEQQAFLPPPTQSLEPGRPPGTAELTHAGGRSPRGQPGHTVSCPRGGDHLEESPTPSGGATRTLTSKLRQDGKRMKGADRRICDFLPRTKAPRPLRPEELSRPAGQCTETGADNTP